MRCRDARDLVSAALDDELGPTDAARLEEHLAGCASCRADRDAYGALRTRWRVAEPFVVDLVPALRERLAGMPAPSVAVLERAPSRRRGARAFMGVTAVAAALALVVAIAVVRRQQDPVHITTTKPAAASELRAPGGASLLLAWTSGGLPSDALTRTRSIVGVDAVTQVLGTELRLTAEHDATGSSRLSLAPGDVIPVDALAIETASYARNLPAAPARLVRALPRDGALLGSTSARLRGIGVGGTLTFGTATVRVTGIVADALVGAAEVVVRDDGPLPITTPRFLLVAYHGDSSDMRAAIAATMPSDVRLRAPGETPFLRHGDAVLPQALVKARFGEFSYRVGARNRVTVDPTWVAKNIVPVTVPGVGTVRCHRLVADALRRALTRAAPGRPVILDGFDEQVVSAKLGLSRHTWGIGISLRVAPAARSRTIAAMTAAGFQWGGHWLNASPDYYEWIGSRAS